jgi:hypothetical protein
MTIFLRTQRVQELIGGRKPVIDWMDDYYAVDDDEIVFGRISREQLPSVEKWRWFFQFVTIPAGIQASGNADTLEQAKAKISGQYRKAREGRR